MAEEIGVVKLGKPFLYEGKEITEINYDFSHLTARDYMEVQKSQKLSGDIVLAASFDTAILLKMFAKASGIAETELERIHFKDAVRIETVTREIFLEDSVEPSNQAESKE